MKYIFGIFVLLFTFTSCRTSRPFPTFDFARLENVKGMIEGQYLNRNPDRRTILSLFNIREEANTVTITFENPNEIKLTYYNELSVKKERIFEGEMKSNFFEIYFKNQQFWIPLIYWNFDVDRVRIGKTKCGKLLIRKHTGTGGSLLFFGAGFSIETPHEFLCASEYKKPTPMKIGDLWGYVDSTGNIVIPAKYDFAYIFEHDIARVKLNNKWGLINLQGEEITPAKYDKISPIEAVFYPPIFRAYIGGKVGILDIGGNEAIPVIYDHIGNTVSPIHFGQSRFVEIRLGDKKGYASRTQVVIPAIYSRIFGTHRSFDGTPKPFAYAIRDGIYYTIDDKGYEYETTESVWLGRSTKFETKRKIEFNEQKIE